VRIYIADAPGSEPAGDGKDGKKRYVTMLGTIKTIAAEEGPGALFKGVAPRVLQLGLNHAIRFTGYQVLFVYFCYSIMYYAFYCICLVLLLLLFSYFIVYSTLFHWFLTRCQVPVSPSPVSASLPSPRLSCPLCLYQPLPLSGERCFLLPASCDGPPPPSPPSPIFPCPIFLCLL
jgi:hypothetical protein